MRNILFLGLVFFLFNCNGTAQQKETPIKSFKISKTDAEWKAQLTETEYNVLRKAVTEPRFSSPFYTNKEKAPMFVKHVTLLYLKVTINMILVRVGQVLIEKLKVTLPFLQIEI